MKIGELAKKTGITVRTLHHYDELNLLKPSCRSEAGHREYSEEDFRRLQKIVTLKNVDIPLEQIKDIIGDPIAKIQEVLDRKVEALEAEIEEKKKVLTKLKSASSYIDLKENVKPEQVIHSIKCLSLNEKYLSEKQLKTMSNRAKKLSPEEVDELVNGMPRRLQALQQYMEEGKDPGDKQVQTVYGEIFELSAKITNNDPKIKAALKKMEEENPELRKEQGISPEFESFLKQAKAILEN